MMILANSDCEALRHVWLGQPVNSISSLAYIVAGAYVLHRSGPKAPAFALAAIGVGSVLYHGSTLPFASVVHNGSLLALALAVPMTWWRGSLPRPPVVAVAVLGAAIAVNLFTRTGAPLCQPDSVLQGHAVWHVLTAIAAAVWLSRKPYGAASVHAESSLASAGSA